jgi:hypothetical protein
MDNSISVEMDESAHDLYGHRYQLMRAQRAPARRRARHCLAMSQSAHVQQLLTAATSLEKKAIRMTNFISLLNCIISGT